MIIFLERHLCFFLRDCKHIQTKVAETYCWAMTRAAEQSCCVPSGSRVFEIGFKLDYLVCTYVVDRIYTQFRLAQNSPLIGYSVT
jgi:hypothetical protein